MVTTGAKISWQFTFMLGLVPVSTVGSNSEPLRLPPQSRRAPPRTASCTQSAARMASLSRMSGPRSLDESSDLGPLIRESDAIRAADWVQEAVRGGARLLCGGNRKGSLFEPTVLTGTKPNMKVNCQEIFAPVVTVEPYNDFASALKQLNNSPYGLQAGLFTRDAKLIFQAYDELEVGGLIAGDVPTFRIDHMPYGGVKDSGLGREGLRDAIQEMTEPKLLVMNLR